MYGVRELTLILLYVTTQLSKHYLLKRLFVVVCSLNQLSDWLDYFNEVCSPPCCCEWCWFSERAAWDKPRVTLEWQCFWQSSLWCCFPWPHEILNSIHRSIYQSSTMPWGINCSTNWYHKPGLFWRDASWGQCLRSIMTKSSTCLFLFSLWKTSWPTG